MQTYKEDKIIDLLIQALELSSSFTPTWSQPENPALPLIIALIAEAKAIRIASKAKFQISFQESSNITQQLSNLKLNA